ncbi:CFI-box-CTERM domain-containing protein [Nitrosopumilus sp. b2]|uniref:CFI-box-CTERM domain-containing protein n=1 Tax=Nitrosopumilus sp. b2 TaxID=2109908 RepID=UPI0015F54195|nr:CFI-box-CTERM domain-containing protein [Nitrosopumilus sp. b2]KAF6245130.1 peptidylprolyl isomerase [Nitrosopumilus sp. b2]
MIVSPVFGQLSDKTGLLTRLDVDVSGHTFEVVTVSNFEILDHEFDKDEKRLTIFANSGLENNLGEVTIPKNLLGGNFTFYLNDVQVTQESKSNNRISFITLNFTGTGDNKIDIIGTNALIGVKEIEITLTDNEQDNSDDNAGGGCLIATATFGSELAPKVQKLRELRDNKLMQTESGENFMNSFNHFYYSFSPQIADYQRQNPTFNELVKVGITPMLNSLSLLNYAETESEVLTIGLSLIILNTGVYFALPAIVIVGIKNLFFKHNP